MISVGDQILDLNVIPNFVYDVHFKNQDCKTVIHYKI